MSYRWECDIYISKFTYKMATFYVSTTGSDTTGNGSQVSPWKTLAKATATVASGNTIHVNAGTYTEGACFLKAGVSIEGDGKSNTLIKSTATGLWSTFTKWKGPLKHIILETVREQDEAYLSTLAGKLYLKEQLIAHMNEFLLNAVVRDIHFNSFLIQ
jgi:flagellar basal body-associated protein FliL